MESSADLHANALMRAARWAIGVPSHIADVAVSAQSRAALGESVLVQALPLSRRAIASGHDLGFTAVNTITVCVAMSLSVGRRPLTRFFAAAPAVHWGQSQYNEARRLASSAPTQGASAEVGNTVAWQALPGFFTANVLAMHLYLSPSVFRPFAAAEAMFTSTPARHRRLFFVAAAVPALGASLRIAHAARSAPHRGRGDDDLVLEQRLLGDFGCLAAVATAGRLYGRTVMMPHYVPQAALLRWTTLPFLAVSRSLLSSAWEEASPCRGLRCDVYHRRLVPAIGGASSSPTPGMDAANAAGARVCPGCNGDASSFNARAAKKGCALVCADCPEQHPVVACAGCISRWRSDPNHVASLALSSVDLAAPVCGGCTTKLVPSSSTMACGSGVACAPAWWKRLFVRRAACSDGVRKGWWCPDCDARTCQACADKMCAQVAFSR